MENKSKKKIFYSVAFLAATVVVFVYFLSSSKDTAQKLERNDEKALPETAKKDYQNQESLVSGAYEQIPKTASTKFDPSLPQWQEWNRRKDLDKKWEWKVPINFYGKAIDQDQRPVSGANVIASITDLSDDGTTVYETETDANGEFSLMGAKGKHLLVRDIRKEGYLFLTKNKDSYEYAAFFQPNYHEPDPDNPAIFLMHKQKPAEPLIVIQEKYKLDDSNRVLVDIKNAKTGAFNGNIVDIQILDNSDPTGKRWEAKISSPGGGIQLTTDEIAAQAPETGYLSDVRIDQDMRLPPGMHSGSLYKGGRFFINTSEGYGLVQFRMIPGRGSLHFTSYFNPSGSRNLEYDPSLAVKP